MPPRKPPADKPTATTNPQTIEAPETAGNVVALVPDTTEPPATNVIEAIRRVMRDLPGIGKVDSSKDVPYAFRGIETLTAHLQPLMAQHGVVIIPIAAEELDSGYEYRSSTNKVWHETHIKYHWAIYGPGGAQDSITASTIGYGRDDQDKGASKAQTQAYKELMIKLFCIGDKSSDPDHVRAEDQDGQTYGTGQPPAQQGGLAQQQQSPKNFVDWHALGWSETPTNNSDELAAAARKRHDDTLAEINVYMANNNIEGDFKKLLLAARKDALGALPLSKVAADVWADVVARVATDENQDPDEPLAKLFERAKASIESAGAATAEQTLQAELGATETDPDSKGFDPNDFGAN